MRKVRVVLSGGSDIPRIRGVLSTMGYTGVAEGFSSTEITTVARTRKNNEQITADVFRVTQQMRDAPDGLRIQVWVDGGTLPGFKQPRQIKEHA